MRTSKKLLFPILILLATGTSLNALAAAPMCADLFTIAESATAESWSVLYKKSDISPRPQLWLRIRQALQKHVAADKHPLTQAGHNPDRIGLAYKKMSQALPLLRDLIDLSQKVDQGYELSHSEFLVIKRKAANQLIQVSHQPGSKMQVFAGLEALRLIATLETRVDFPKTPEQVREEKKEAKKEEQKKEDKDAPEEPPQWNKTKEKYEPKNKDVGGKGGNKKNVDLVLTDAPVAKRLLRQRIYDQFDLKNWSSTPSLRENQTAESKFTKKLVLNPLGESTLEVPLPYGYSVIPGKYPDHTIREVGTGEFTVHLTHGNLVTLGLTKVKSEAHLGALPKTVSADELAKWPAHLLLFTQSLKGLPAVEAAAKLEKYISEEGGFLYYSQGDKISEKQLKQIDTKVKELTRTLPMPMALAHVGTFNCDGAAWIGALMLRDVLQAPVRIAGGRTSAGTKVIKNETYSVSKSADPAHAWVEVFDGKKWVPFDMTPKNNAPSGDPQSSDVKKEDKPKDQEQKPEEKKKKDKKKDSKNESGAQGESKSQDKKDAEKAKNEKSAEEKKNDKASEEKKDEKKDSDQLSDDSKKVEDMIKAKSTERKAGEESQALIDKLLKRNELVLLEHLIFDGFKTEAQNDFQTVLNTLGANPAWTNTIERSRQKGTTFIYDASFVRYKGLATTLNETRLLFSQNKARDAKQEFMTVQRLFLSLAEYRPLKQNEKDALAGIDSILRALNSIKHQNSKEFDVVDDMLKSLPGQISKSWLTNQYGKDYEKLGTSANQALAKDLVDGKLKPLLQMGAVREFVDMTLNSTPEAQFKDEPTLNRSLVPKPRQDLIITRNPLDFAKMLWTVRPGEHMFAPTLQGRQFAIGSLETRRLPNPKNQIERKVSVIYYDVSNSMRGEKIETQDALLMAFVDKALSEADAIGRPIHEVYLAPFSDTVGEIVHISSREDALNYISRRMSFTTQVLGGTNLQKTLENFYDIIGTSHKNKSAQGREKLFQKANMVLFSDGEAPVDMAVLAQKRAALSKDIEINMNFVNIGDKVNDVLKDLTQNQALASGKPKFRMLTDEMYKSVAQVKATFDSDAFATDKNISGQMMAEITKLLAQVQADPRLQGDQQRMDQALSQLQITKAKVETLPGLREAVRLTRLAEMLVQTPLDGSLKKRLTEIIAENYTTIAGRSWKDMTYQEKEALENLKAWGTKGR